MRATKIMKQRGTVPSRTLGHVRGIKPGDKVEGRGELDALAVHNMAAQGIDSVQGKPAFAICMSGGYVDDVDTGEVIEYTGMGGQSGKHQVKDQVLKAGNAGLKLAYDEQTPVRVCRAAGSIVRDGVSFRQYAYEGLYLVRATDLCAPTLFEPPVHRAFSLPA
jgi:SAD/SRA domain